MRGVNPDGSILDEIGDLDEDDEYDDEYDDDDFDFQVEQAIRQSIESGWGEPDLVEPIESGDLSVRGLEDFPVEEVSLSTLEELSLHDLMEELSFVEVSCYRGCGTFQLGDVAVVDVRVRTGTVRWRCPSCNELQTSWSMFLPQDQMV